mmetsp:Transcript_23139/g.31695  ORF Transcript_23139/g.31695 Transcript_23139/m.31695 type:complete len:473 (-) Transcript_23139:183-1601(-)
MSLLVTIAFILSGISYAFDSLPERARHGKAQKLFDNLYRTGKTSSLTSSLTWSAKLDNFDASNQATFEQRFYVNDQYWEAGVGPVFLYIGGEGTLNGPPGGYIATLAKEHSALILALEHRFYGESVPYNNATTANYQYLSVEQALADLSGFTDYYKSLSPKSAASKWIAFGGSYPGALASWYRTAYPSQTVGSLSSSGVVNCIVDFQGFDMQVSAAVGNDCANNVKRVQRAFQSSIEMPDGSINPVGWAAARDLLACESDLSVTDFYYMLADSWSMAVQYSNKQRLCDALSEVSTQSDSQATQTFATFTKDYWGEDFCASGFYNTKALADPARWDVNSRSWRYQTCSQVTYFNTAPASGSLRAASVDLSYHLSQCQEMFGQELFPTKGSLQMNARYGGPFPKSTKVFFSDFSDDPWQRASVTFSPGDDQPYHLAMCDQCGHCRDFSTPQASDPPALKESRVEFESYLNQWLK